MKTMKTLKTNHGKLNLPAFFPDATYGHIIGLNKKDLNKLKIDGIVVNAYHILKHNIINNLNKNIHKFMNFSKPIISDSGGFQVFSLIHKNKELGKINKNGAIFKLKNVRKMEQLSNFSEHPENLANKQKGFLDKTINLTPEKAIQVQLKIGSDIIMCLDDCTHSSISYKKQKKSVNRTIKWARRCKKEFDKLTKNKTKKNKNQNNKSQNKNQNNKPLLFAIIQGGNYKDLRKFCAGELIKMNFDGYSFGGFPINKGKLLKGILKYTSSLIPNNKLKYAMGIGKPDDIVKCVELGYNLFDCVIPTRDARHKRLYVFTKNPEKLNFKKIIKNNSNSKIKFYKEIRVCNNSKIKLKYCDCELCRKYSVKELNKLFKTNYEQAVKLATIHNLGFYSQLIKILRR